MTPGRCADISAEAGESLGATALTARDWLLVEVSGTWPRDVSDGAGLDEGARGAVTAWLASMPSPRVLYLRRPTRPRGRRLVFVVRATEREASVRRIELADGEGGIGDADLTAGGEIVDEPLVLVCGHGTRDACCALRGNAVYAALDGLVAPDALWLSSHQGGHRFAANVLVLPGGIHLGRLDAESARTHVQAAIEDRIALEHYRGRTTYSAREQAAERAVREATGLTALADLTLAGDDGEHVAFLTSDARELRAKVDEVSGPSVPASCGVEPAPQRHLAARLA